MENRASSRTARIGRAGSYLLLLALALFVFVVLSHFRPLLPKSADLAVRIGSGAALLAASLVARRNERCKALWRIPFALFTALVAISVDYYLRLGQRMWSLAGIVPESPAGWAIDRLGGSLTIIVFVIALTLASGDTLSSLYVRKGRLGLGLAVGLSTFVLAAATAVPLAVFMFGGRDLSPARILPWTPWLLVFILANASAEELLFRGLFLGRLEPFFGRFPSNLLVALAFVLMHYGVPYTPRQALFLAVVLPLALAWGWLMQKSDGIWGSILFHAGMDISVILGLFSNPPAS